MDWSSTACLKFIDRAALRASDNLKIPSPVRLRAARIAFEKAQQDAKESTE